VKRKKAPKKSSSAKYKKRRRRERGNRATKKRVKAEFEFAQRIRKEPSLKEIIDRDGY